MPVGTDQLAKFMGRCVTPFEEVRCCYYEEKGYIVWRRGTGDNCELLHIRTFEKSKGHGRWLVYRMLDRLRSDPPYYSIFGFTRSNNESAKQFYGALGFNLQPIDGLYRDGISVLFWQDYNKLVDAMEYYRGDRIV